VLFRSFFGSCSCGQCGFCDGNIVGICFGDFGIYGFNGCFHCLKTGLCGKVCDLGIRTIENGYTLNRGGSDGGNGTGDFVIDVFYST
jgi:hypothetical protein